MVNLCKFKKYRGRGKKMERQLKQFFDFLENDKKLSENTLQSYKRDLKQFRKYLESYGLHYNRVKEEDMENYIKELQEQGKKASSISRCIASIRSIYCLLKLLMHHNL